MGKPYSNDLMALPDAYRWASSVPIDRLVQWIGSVSSLPLMVVGSGGSLTSAHFAAQLHQAFTGMVAKAVTPLEIASANVQNTAVMFASAAGKNPDIVGAFRTVAGHESRRLATLCLRSGSPLAREAEEFGLAHSLEFDLPTGKDGFLATGSLMATAILLWRGYATVASTVPNLPTSFQELQEIVSIEAARAETDVLDSVWKRETLLVLHGPSTQPAAADLESKFSEAALGNVQVADLRNFAHGRHHWIAKRGDRTAILSVTCDDDRALAERTLRLVPQEVQCAKLDVRARGSLAALAALVGVFELVGLAGKHHGIDPGKPGVPAFGSRIYNLAAFSQRSITAHQDQPPRHVVKAIERKAQVSYCRLVASGRANFWREAAERVLSTLQSQHYSAVVLDYDGTLCDEHDRFSGVSEALGEELSRILALGAWVGVATGRGKSAGIALRQILSDMHWSRVIVGYYNGAVVAPLTDESAPSVIGAPSPSLRELKRRLKADTALTDLATVEIRPHQLTILPRWAGTEPMVWHRVQELALTIDPTLSVVRSSHSVDVASHSGGKLRVVGRIGELQDHPLETMRIGDRGAWPGNDYALLASPLGLSVDEVSCDAEGCWNFANPGMRGAQVTLQYLRCLDGHDGRLAFAMPSTTRIRVTRP